MMTYLLNVVRFIRKMDLTRLERWRKHLQKCLMNNESFKVGEVEEHSILICNNDKLQKFLMNNKSFKVGEVEEAAERRARNLQRRQHQMETEVGRDF